MDVRVGGDITIDVTKPAAGGRMLARYDGQVVLVRGAIPGERVRARVEKIGKGVLYAETVDVLSASPDRRPVTAEPECGGAVYAHIAYERQRQLKGEIIADALARIGRLNHPAPAVVGSPERGYRMRARLHVRSGRLGFFREGTHDLCDAAATGQLLPETGAWLQSLESTLATSSLVGLRSIELAENIPGAERACYLELDAGADAAPFARLTEAGQLTGMSAGRVDRPGVTRLAGDPVVADSLHLARNGATADLRLGRDVRAFFQANRFLLELLVNHVAGLVREGPVIDLYAGVGLFGLSLAALGFPSVTLVESDAASSASLVENATPFGSRVNVQRCAVESFLERQEARVGGEGRLNRLGPDTSVIVDPPRTGMSKAALDGIVAAQPSQIVYVSCDVATFARDTRRLLDGGYALDALTGMDLFPNTAHVEAVASFTREST